MNDAISLISQDIFDKVRSRFRNLEMGNEDGNITSDPREARFFDFDFVIEGNTLGRVSISINERGALKIFYSQGILEDTGPIIQKMWFDFLREMRMFAKRRLLRFDTRDITKSNLNKTDFLYLASTGTKEDNMAESKMFENRNTKLSTWRPISTAKVIIRHHEPIPELPGIGNRARSEKRNIKSIFIQNKEGERYKMPVNNIRAADAMARHVCNGGIPHDTAGKRILEMATEISQLESFCRQVPMHDSMNNDAHTILERTKFKLDSLRRTLENISKQRYYENWKEGVQEPADDGLVLDQIAMENYKSAFTERSFSENLTQYFPLIHKIMKETGEVDLANYVGESREDEDVCDKCNEDPCCCEKNEGFAAFENWADSVVEGNLDPDTIDQIFSQLNDLMQDDTFPVGPDATSTVEALEGIGFDQLDDFNTLEDALKSLSKIDPEADATTTIATWIQKNYPNQADKLATGNGEEPTAPAAAETPPEEPAAQPPADQEAKEDKEEENKNPSLLDIANMVKGFYDRETGKFPIGKTGVITKVKKKLGDHAAKLAERLINALEENHHENNMDEGSADDDRDDAFSDLGYENRRRRKKQSPFVQGGTDAWYHYGFQPKKHGFRPGTPEYDDYKRGYENTDTGPRGGKQWNESSLTDKHGTPYQEGKDAFHKGKHFDDCPYPEDSDECDEWTDGFTDAMPDNPKPSDVFKEEHSAFDDILRLAGLKKI